jgi:sugar phosphate isomerase/epimerase
LLNNLDIQIDTSNGQDMELNLFKTLWGYPGSLQQAIQDAQNNAFDGLEGPAPENHDACVNWRRQLDESALKFVAEITTAGSYVPERTASLQDHLYSFEKKIECSLLLDPVFITCLGGCDAWPEQDNIMFFEGAMKIADAAGISVSFETHRGRALFNPWVTERITQALPEMKLTCDFSHWCVVCERLMDSEVDTIEKIAPQVMHIHARVGYDQGPQVPHPAAPEHEVNLRAHQRWWEIIWRAQLQAGLAISTMTPEFGPDGYLHELPFTRKPVADLERLNNWMAVEEREHFARFMSQRS